MSEEKKDLFTRNALAKAGGVQKTADGTYAKTFEVPASYDEIKKKISKHRKFKVQEEDENHIAWLEGGLGNKIFLRSRYFWFQITRIPTGTRVDIETNYEALTANMTNWFRKKFGSNQ